MRVGPLRRGPDNVKTPVECVQFTTFPSEGELVDTSFVVNHRWIDERPEMENLLVTNRHIVGESKAGCVTLTLVGTTTRATLWLALALEDRENTRVMALSHELRRVINGNVRERLAREGRIHGAASESERLASKGYANAERSLPATTQRATWRRATGAGRQASNTGTGPCCSTRITEAQSPRLA